MENPIRRWELGYDGQLEQIVTKSGHVLPDKVEGDQATDAEDGTDPVHWL